MPPAAATVAGRLTDDHPAAPARTPRAPRRVSGPARPESRTDTRKRARPDVRPSSRATAAAAALEAQLAPAPTRTRRPAPAPARPRREAPSRSRGQTARRARTNHAPRLALRLQAPRLDRIVRGRAWIPVLGALLVAIVGLRVEVLKLGAGVGSQVQQATALQSSNAALRSQISALSDDHRIATLAASYGMHMPNPLDTHFVQASAGTHVGAAIRHISAPSPQTFAAGLAAEQRADDATTQAGLSLSAVGSAPTTSTSLTGNSATGTSTSTGTGASTSLTTGMTSTSTSSGGGAGTSGTGATSSGTGGINSGTSGAATGTSSTSGTSVATGGTTPPSTGAGTSGLTAGGSGTSLAAGTSQTTGSASGGSGLAG